MINRIALINKSTSLSNTDLGKAAAACNTQISRDVAPLWGRSSVPVTFYADEKTVPSTAARIYIFDNADQAGALGYHSETMNGIVFGKVFAKTILSYGLPVLYDTKKKTSITISSVISHEVIEMFVNPYINLWTDGTPIAEGSEYCVEACDAVEANVYQINTGYPAVPVSVSNFVTPEYFDIATPAGKKLDYMNLLKTPFTMTPDGYMIVRNGPGTETEIYGEKYPKFLKDLHS